MFRKSHFTEYGVEPFASVKVPGIIKFFGFFAELYYGRSITGTSNESLVISISPREDQVCNIFLPDSGDRRHFSLSTMKYKAEDKVLNYVKAVFKHFSYLKPCGFDITISGELMESGACILASSVGTGLVALFNKYYDQGFSNIQIAQKAYNAINSFCGNTCFLSDTITMANAGSDSLISYSFKTGKLTYLGKTPSTSDKCLLQLSADFDKEVTEETINDFIASLRECCRRMPIGFIEADKVDHNAFIKTVPSDLRAWVEYMLLEERITQNAFDSCIRGKFGIESRMLTKMYKCLSDDLNLFFPEYDWVKKRALEMCDCLGTGLAFNGLKPVVHVSIKKYAVERFVCKLSDYDHIFGTKINYIYYEPSDGIELN